VRCTTSLQLSSAEICGVVRMTWSGLDWIERDTTIARTTARTFRPFNCPTVESLKARPTRLHHSTFLLLQRPTPASTYSRRHTAHRDTSQPRQRRRRHTHLTFTTFNFWLRRCRSPLSDLSITSLRPSYLPVNFCIIRLCLPDTLSTK